MNRNRNPFAPTGFGPDDIEVQVSELLVATADQSDAEPLEHRQPLAEQGHAEDRDQDDNRAQNHQAEVRSTENLRNVIGSVGSSPRIP